MNEEHFGERLRKVRKALGLTQGQLADRLGISQGSLSSAEIGRNFLGTPQLNRLIDSFNISIDYLLTGKGPMFISDRPETIPVGNAGAAIQAEPKGMGAPQVSIPSIGPVTLVKVQGESMDPFLLPGDYVGCTQLRSIRDMDPSKVYVVNTRDSGVYVKFVLLTDDRLILRSANPAYPDEQIPLQDVVSLCEVKVRITRHVVPVHDVAALQLRIKRIEDMLRRQHHDIRKEL